MRSLSFTQLGNAPDLGEPVRNAPRLRDRISSIILVGHDRGPDERRGLDHQTADRLAQPLPRRLGHDARAHAPEHLDEAQTARVEAHVLDHYCRTGCDARSHSE